MKPTATKATAGVLARYAHAKLDGHFLRVWVTTNTVRYESSQGTTIEPPFHIHDLCEALPNGVYLGELFVPGKPASCIKTALKESWPELQLTFFAIEKLNDGLGFNADAPLEDVHAFFDEYQCNFAPYEVISNVPIELSEAELFMYRQRARTAGIEGWMLKTGNLTGWAKLKVENTIDLVVLGSNAGQGKYFGLVGSLICGVYTYAPLQGGLIEVADVGGMDDSTRRKLTKLDCIGALVGIVVEVKYQNVDSKGRLRHPRFLRVREDKLPHECTLQQDSELLAYYERN